MAHIYYKRLIEGCTIPAIIHNMDYFYIDMPVYEDASLDCWERISFEQLEEKLLQNWLVTEIPLGKTLSIHGLGSYTIKNSQWIHTQQTYKAYIYSCINKMNPEMHGLFEESSIQKEKWEKQRVSWTTHPTPYKIKGNFGYDIIDGNTTSLFYKSNNQWQLTSITAFKDKTLTIEHIDNKVFSLDEVSLLFDKGLLSSDIKGENQIIIPNLGTINTITEYGTDSKEKQKEIADLLRNVCGEKTLHQICREKYYHYLEYPNEENRQELTIAYESVPEHQRIYLGDMDSKDWDFRRIIYNPEKKRTV